MVSFDTLIGLLAGIFTTASHLPQLYKSWRTGETAGLSLKMILVLGAGLTLWCIYGLRRGDLAIIIANGTSVALLSGILYFKLRSKAAKGAGGECEADRSARLPPRP